MTWTDVKWLFFDLGNTLISEEEPIRDRIEGLAAVFEERGIRVSFGDVEQSLLRASAEFASRPIVRAIELLAPRAEDRAYVLERLTYRKELERPYPGAVGLVSRLSTKYQVGVIANQSPGTEARLRRDGFAPYTSLCLASAELGLKKPDPAIFRLALERAGCESHEAVMIGDRVDNDIRPARALGWRTIRVLQGIARVQEPRDPLEGADQTAEDLAQIEAFLA